MTKEELKSINIGYIIERENKQIHEIKNNLKMIIISRIRYGCKSVSDGYYEVSFCERKAGEEIKISFGEAFEYLKNKYFKENIIDW